MQTDLQTILETEQILLVDSNMFCANGRLTEEIYPCSRYKEINMDSLHSTKMRFERGLKLLSRENTFLVKEVYNEIRQLLEILSEKAREMNNHHHFVSNKTKKKYGKKMYDSREAQQNKVVFNILCGYMCEILRLTKKPEKLYKPTDKPLQETLSETIKVITDIVEFKKIGSNHSLYMPRKYRKQHVDFMTDEKLVASFLESSMFRKTALISRDRDLLEILRGIYNILNMPELKQYLSVYRILDNMNNSLSSFYMPKEGGFRQYQLSELYSQDSIGTRLLSSKDRVNIINSVHQIWDKASIPITLMKKPQLALTYQKSTELSFDKLLALPDLAKS